MGFFDFFKKKNKIFSDEHIEKEYEKAWRKHQSVKAKRGSLPRAIKVYAEKKCTPQEGDDLLAKKEAFIRYYSFLARIDRYYHSLNYKKGRFNSSPLWCQKWQNQEQRARFQAQCVWHKKMVHGSYRNHMRQKFMNQKTR